MRESMSTPGDRSFDATYDIGGDIKLGLGPNVMLDATINPDFGQVRSDPAVLNLTAFETVFREKRPFFMEGADIFQFRFGRSTLFYSHRIGVHESII
ncbi:MAG: DUF5916 domain-containing protein [Bacteroidales bacterium]